MPNLLPYRSIYPVISDKAFVASSADVIGKVTIGEYANIWYQCVIRGDVSSINIGKYTNIQDGTVIHVDKNESDQDNTGATVIGDRVTIGHNCLIHACRIEDESFVGMSSTVMSNAVIEKHGMLAAGSLLTENKIVPRGQLWGRCASQIISFINRRRNCSYKRIC